MQALGGGIVTLPLLGQPSSVFMGEFRVPQAVIAWYLVYVLNFGKFFDFGPLKFLRGVFLALHRTHAICGMVQYANSILPVSEYYASCNLFGPIIAGTINGCMGFFLPLDRGLEPINNGTAWVIQFSFIAATFFHFMINDLTGPFGIAFRGAFGTQSEASVKLMLASVNILSILLQYFFHPESNLFTPIHKLGYLIFQVNGPKGLHLNKKKDDTVGWPINKRVILERMLELSRVLLVVSVISAHIYFNHPPSQLETGKFLTVDSYIGSCQMDLTLSGCTPYLMRLEQSKDNKGNASYKIASYSAKGKYYSPSTEPIWSLPLKINSKTKVAADAYSGLLVGEDGTVRLIARSDSAKSDELLWSSSTTCATTDGNSTNKVSLVLEAGIPSVKCSDGKLLPL